MPLQREPRKDIGVIWCVNEKELLASWLEGSGQREDLEAWAAGYFQKQWLDAFYDLNKEAPPSPLRPILQSFLVWSGR